MKLLVGVVSIVLASCSGATGPAGPEGTPGQTGQMGAQGATGAAGADGKDGALRIYGDGSGLAHVVSANESWLTSPPDSLQFTDFTIDAGAYLGVPSGTIIRVTGTFTNNGTLAAIEAITGQDELVAGAPPSPAPQSGIGMTSAASAQIGAATTFVRGGGGGRGITTRLQARMVLNPGPKGGGGGGSTLMGRGGDGGATVIVLAHGAIVNSATGNINANGYPADFGGGGGGGGVVILASATSVTNDGTIEAHGGDAMGIAMMSGAGGGGGGGIIHLLAPTITQGTCNVSGGMGGGAGTVMNDPRGGGGGGGGAGGFGGSGGGVQTNGTAAAGQNGQQGWALTTTGDPSSLF